MGTAVEQQRPVAARQSGEAQGPGGLLRRSTVEWLAQHAVGVVAASWLVTRVYLWWVRMSSPDVATYWHAADLWLQGQLPYRDFPLEHPPGALVLFALPRLFAAEFATYQSLFAGLMVLFDLGIVCVLWRLPAAALGESVGAKVHSLSAEGRASSHRYDSLTAVGGYLALTAIAGPLCFARCDLVPAFLICAFFLAALRRPQGRVLPELLLALAIWVNVVLVVLLLPFAAWRAAEASGANPGPSLGRSAATLVGLLVALFLPFYLLSGAEPWELVSRSMGRGLQLESTYASVLMVFSQVSSLSLRTEYLNNTQELAGPLASAVATAAPWILVAGQLAVGAWSARQVRRSPTSGRRQVFARAVLAQLAAFLILDGAFSSHRLLWLAPLCALFFAQPSLTSQRRAANVFAVFLLSWLIVRFYLADLGSLQPIATALLLARTSALVLIFIELIRPAREEESGPLRDANRTLSRIWPYLTAALFLGWVVAAGLTDETDADIFFHLKVAEDILQSSTFPVLDTYSATAAGRPFVAHEWLSSMVFFGTQRLFGSAGLNWLVALLAAGCIGMMFWTLSKPVRRSVLALPLLMFASYLVFTRVHMRPHMFSLVLEAVLMAILERWRVTRSWRVLVGLVPMQVLWVNLHGGALLAPTIVGVVFVAVALSVRFPRLQSAHPEDAAFTWDHVRQLFLLELAMLAATTVNPYGPNIFPFAIRLGSGPGYLTRLVTEWRPTLHLANRLDYWFWPYLAYLVVLGVCLVARRREKPVIDLLLALVLGWMSLRARRFLGEFAVLTFPIMARSIYRALEGRVEPRFWLPRHGFNLALTSLMFATTLAYGLAINMFAHRHLGTGMGGDLAYDEVAYLETSGIRGAIMNDYEDGGLIIRELSPNLRPVMDSRIDIYGPALVKEWMRASFSPDAFAAYADKYGVNVVLRRGFTLRSDEVRAYLTSSPDWERLPSSPKRYMFVRKRPLEAAGH